MSRWMRATADTWCGLCSEPIRVGDPMRLISQAEKRRCAGCAGESVPANLDPIPAVERQVSPVFAPVSVLSRSAKERLTRMQDWKAKQSGAE